MEIARFNDDIWPIQPLIYTRKTVRAIVVNKSNEFGFIHIVGEDDFGKRDHLETIGGGIENNETESEALKREVKEELGLTVLEYRKLGTIIDSYNLLKRTTISTFFYVLVDTSETPKTNLTESEKLLFKEILWFQKDAAIKELKNVKCEVGKLVQQRDLAALEYFLNSYL